MSQEEPIIISDEPVDVQADRKRKRCDEPEDDEQPESKQRKKYHEEPGSESEDEPYHSSSEVEREEAEEEEEEDDELATRSHFLSGKDYVDRYWYILDKLMDYERDLRGWGDFANVPPEIMQYLAQAQFLNMYLHKMSLDRLKGDELEQHIDEMKKEGYGNLLDSFPSTLFGKKVNKKN